MCLSVEANGFGTSKGMHISVLIHIMKGEFDDQLKWPYVSKIMIMLVDQLENRRHCTKTVSFYQAPEVYEKRVTNGATNPAGYGTSSFLSHCPS